MESKDPKTLYRSRTDRVIAGVIGGIGEYTNVDSNVLRLIFILLLVFTAFIPLTIFYIIAMLLIPEEPA